MLKRNLDILQLLQELDQKLKTKKIIFWIDGQDCYLWENTFHYTNKIKVGNLSLTKENYFKNLTEELEKQTKERIKREEFLISKFQEISDVELIEELKNREKTIKLKMYVGNQSIWIEGKDIKCGIYHHFPIEVKEKDHDWK